MLKSFWIVAIVLNLTFVKLYERQVIQISQMQYKKTVFGNLTSMTCAQVMKILISLTHELGACEVSEKHSNVDLI